MQAEFRRNTLERSPVRALVHLQATRSCSRVASSAHTGRARSPYRCCATSTSTCAARSVACTGRSGAGKSTLLHVLGLLDSADGGQYWLGAHNVSDLDDNARAHLRGVLLGFVLQLHNLLPRTSALENVAAPLVYRGVRDQKLCASAAAALEAVGLADRAAHEPEPALGWPDAARRHRACSGRRTPRSCSSTNRPATSTSPPRPRCSSCFDALHREGRTIVHQITHEEDVAAHARAAGWC